MANAWSAAVRGRSAGNAFGYAAGHRHRPPGHPAGPAVQKATKQKSAWSPGRRLRQIRPPYWLRGYHPGDTYGIAAGTDATHQRSGRRNPCTSTRQTAPEQLRGLPWMHAAMTRLNNLGGYGSRGHHPRASAPPKWAFTSPDGQPPMDGEDAQASPIWRQTPAVSALPPPASISSLSARTTRAPCTRFSFKACLRHRLRPASPITRWPMTSGRQFQLHPRGTLEERDQWISLQEWFKDAFMDRYSTTGWPARSPSARSRLPTARRFRQKAEKFTGHVFQGRRWSWVDPLRT